MSASDLGPAYTDATLFDTLCQTLEEDLAKKTCAALKKAVADPICTSVKQRIHNSFRADSTSDPVSRSDGKNAYGQIRPALEDTLSDAVCAALKQAFDDTACRTITSAIHHSFALALRRERIENVHFVLSVTPSLVDSFCDHVEQITGNAVCAALKEALDDTVCTALKKGMQHWLSQITSHGPRQDIAETRELSLNKEFTWHPPLQRTTGDTVGEMEEAAIKEVCGQLKTSVTTTLCRLLQHIIKDTVGQHSAACKAQCQRWAEPPKKNQAPRIPVRSAAVILTAGFIVASLLVATVAPGAPLQSGISKALAPIAPLIGPSNLSSTGSNGGGSNGGGSNGGGSNGGGATNGGTKIATTLDVYVPPVYYGEGLLPNPENSQVTQGQTAVVEYAINAADGTHPCGAANFYIDNAPAPGSSKINQPTSGYGCPAGVSGGAGELFMSPNDTANLSPGTHTLGISYQGNDTYGPAQYEAEFIVTSSSPSTGPVLVQTNNTIATPSNQQINVISPQLSS